MSGPPLGRPPTNISKSTKKQAQLDERIRNSIEGKFGEAKRRFSLGRVMAKLSNTSLSNHRHNFSGDESFCPAAAGFLAFFMSISQQKPFFRFSGSNN